MVARPVNFLHISKIASGTIMAGSAGRQHCAVVHPLDGKRCRAGVAQRAFISRHSGGRNRRNMVTRLCHDTGISATMAGLASPDSNTSMRISCGQPDRITMVAGVARGCGRQMRCRFDFNIRVTTDMTGAA